MDPVLEEFLTDKLAEYMREHDPEVRVEIERTNELVKALGGEPCERSRILSGDYSELERRIIGSYRPEAPSLLPKPIRYFTAYLAEPVSPKGLSPSEVNRVVYGWDLTAETASANAASSVLTSWLTGPYGSSSPDGRSLKEKFLTTVAACAVAANPYTLNR